MGSGSDEILWRSEMASNPSTISDLDDNQEDELQVSEANVGALLGPRSVFPSGMILSLLYQMCSAYEKEPGQRDKMYRLICQEMSKLNMLPHQSIVEAFRPVRMAYTKTFRKMMQSVLEHLHDESEPRMLSLPSTEKERTALLLRNQSPLFRQPKITDEEMIFSHTTRYETEFDELKLLGQGGFGRVFKVRSKLDERHYAIKKIKLEQMSPDKSQKLINEVKVLSRLKHPNVVGYNTSWMEMESVKSASPRSNFVPREPVANQKCLPSSSESPRSSSELESSTRDKDGGRADDFGIGDGEESPRMWIPAASSSVSPLAQFLQQSPAAGQGTPSIVLSRSPSDSSSTIVKSPSVAGSPVTPVGCHGDGLYARAAQPAGVCRASEKFSFSQESYSITSESCRVSSSMGTSRSARHSEFGKATEVSAASCERDSSWEGFEDLEIASRTSACDYPADGAFGFSRPEDDLDEFGDIRIGQVEPVEVPEAGTAPLSSGRSSALDVNRNSAWRASMESALFPGIFGQSSLLKCSSIQSGSVQIVNLDEAADKPKPEGGHRRRRRRRRSKRDEVGAASAASRANGLLPPLLSDLTSFRPVLYIQMQLCSTTLSDWLEMRNQDSQDGKDSLDVVDREGNMDIFKQILDGMHYIHSKGLIHRDLKVTNPTEDVDADGLPDEQGSHDFPPDYHQGQWGLGRTSAANTADVGTTIYASPEQLQGSNYDCKADMYSSGIILFEMFHPFSTEMERYKVIEVVRGGCVPDEIRDRWPDQCKTICQLTHSDCYQRPSAGDILKGPLFKSKDEVISGLQKKVSEQDLEIQQLRRQIESLKSGKK